MHSQKSAPTRCRGAWLADALIDPLGGCPRWQPNRPDNECKCRQWRKVPERNAHDFWSCLVHLSWRHLPTARDRYGPTLTNMGIKGRIVKSADCWRPGPRSSPTCQAENRVAIVGELLEEDLSELQAEHRLQRAGSTTRVSSARLGAPSSHESRDHLHLP